MTSTTGNGSGAGTADSPDSPDSPDNEQKTIEQAMEEAYAFPGFYPVVVIARQGLEFEADLQATLAAVQGEDPFQIKERASRAGNYVSYRVEIYVSSPQQALERKTLLGNLPGVLLIL